MYAYVLEYRCAIVNLFQLIVPTLAVFHTPEVWIFGHEIYHFVHVDDEKYGISLRVGTSTLAPGTRK